MTVYPKASMIRRSGRGEPLRFLGILALLWIGGRMLAYGVPQQWFAIDSSADPRIEIIEKIIAQAGAADGDDTAPAASQLVRSSPGSAQERPISGQGTRLALAGLPKALLAQHHLLYWQQTGYSSPIAMPLSSDAMTPDPPARTAKFRLDNLGHKAAAPRQQAGANRFAIDAWLFARAGGGIAPIGGGSQYGGSQTGAIARYMLGDGSAAAPMLFARATRALSGPSQAELAFGVSARPIANLPVRVAAEQRLALDDSGFSRPSLYAVTEIPRASLPHGASLDVYAQAGAIGVDNPAWFFDLQMVAQKPLVESAGKTVSVGAGLWSGGQGPIGSEVASGVASVARLDIGPRAALNLSVAGQPAQLSVDWRQRIAGNAAPGSGPAMTVSTRF